MAEIEKVREELGRAQQALQQVKRRPPMGRTLKTTGRGTVRPGPAAQPRRGRRRLQGGEGAAAFRKWILKERVRRRTHGREALLSQLPIRKALEDRSRGACRPTRLAPLLGSYQSAPHQPRPDDPTQVERFLEHRPKAPCRSLCPPWGRRGGPANLAGDRAGQDLYRRVRRLRSRRTNRLRADARVLQIWRSNRRLHSPPGGGRVRSSYRSAARALWRKGARSSSPWIAASPRPRRRRGRGKTAWTW